jgi:hypothetical protein
LCSDPTFKLIITGRIYYGAFEDILMDIAKAIVGSRIVAVVEEER